MYNIPDLPQFDCEPGPVIPLEAWTPMFEMYAAKVGQGFLYEMEHKGFRAVLKRALRLQRVVRNGKEVPHQLPSGASVPVFPVDALPGCPEEWIRGPGNFVCPVEADWGLWFDWTHNDHFNTAVLPSVKGMNPITGQKLEGLRLEKYDEKCPIHNVAFKDGRYCEECKYKWPPQSYVSHPNTLWWDGFRQSDGSVRQFFFTEDEARDIASLVIGKENTVPAFGFAFFEPIKQRVPEMPPMTRGVFNLADSGPGSFGKKLIGAKMKSSGYKGKGICGQSVNQVMYSSPSSVSSPSYCSSGAEVGAAAVDMCCLNSAGPGLEVEEKTAGGVNTLDWHNGVLRSAMPTSRELVPEETINLSVQEEVKSVSVGAGAEIAQELDVDKMKVTEWKPEASSVMRLYFVFRKQWNDILKKGGIKDLTGNKEGFLKGLPVG